MESDGLKLIRAMSELTGAGKLTWAKVDYDRYEADAEEKTFVVEFVYFALTNDFGSDRTMARLTAFGVMFDYCIGTEGMGLLCEMLAFSDQEWSEWRSKTQRKVSEGLKFLQGL